MKESILQKACLDYLEYMRLHGAPIIATRTNSGKVKTNGYYMQLCRAGWPDITATINEKSVFIETKTLTGKQGDAQKEIETAQKKAGGEYWIIRTISELKARLSELI